MAREQPLRLWRRKASLNIKLNKSCCGHEPPNALKAEASPYMSQRSEDSNNTPLLAGSWTPASPKAAAVPLGILLWHR
eukprot:CAMPEP_0183449896 /NCGR_PEP_ID=MMETSP0370-20130417/111099_1 /TAXON_ID=268820 /ORGANISM="Peridinium aciculiferum, Strain PAER-2" /LENGTH=77 /DNA_ID=CAMNT_0025641017 /DNA_START=29 /DNA_END=259 /DNA_ORIENTATION=+